MSLETKKFVRENNYRQHLFIKYTFGVLVDLTVLNLFNQYWENVYIENFMLSLLVAILLQALLQVTLVVEHKVAGYFTAMSGVKAKIMRGFSTWGILFISKLLILQAIHILFGESVMFHGAYHGVVPFIVVVIAIIVAEQSVTRIHRSLAD